MFRRMRSKEEARQLPKGLVVLKPKKWLLKERDRYFTFTSSISLSPGQDLEKEEGDVRRPARHQGPGSGASTGTLFGSPVFRVDCLTGQHEIEELVDVRTARIQHLTEFFGAKNISGPLINDKVQNLGPLLNGSISHALTSKNRRRLMLAAMSVQLGPRSDRFIVSVPAHLCAKITSRILQNLTQASASVGPVRGRG